MTAERITLEVPATQSALATMRIVLGGLCARLDYPLEELDDLSIAVEELFHAALQSEKLESFVMVMAVTGADLSLSAGEFRSAALRDQVETDGIACLDLCRLLRNSVDDVVVEGAGDAYRVVLLKRGRTGAA